VKVSTPSIYKKVIKLEEKGYITGSVVKGEKNSEKAVYSLTPRGEEIFEKLMLKVSSEPIHIFLNFNAVIVNLDSLSIEKQKQCIANIESNVRILKGYIEDNMKAKTDIPATGRAVLEQQLILVEAIEKWLLSIKKSD
jgi:DNA-binding PadR family transcriptional regulator